MTDYLADLDIESEMGYDETRDEDEKFTDSIMIAEVSQFFLDDLAAIKAKLHQQEGAISIFSAIENENDEKTEELIDEACQWLLKYGASFVTSDGETMSPQEIASTIENMDTRFHQKLLKGFAEENDVVIKELFDIVVKMEIIRKLLKNIPMVAVDTNISLHHLAGNPEAMEEFLEGFSMQGKTWENSEGVIKTKCEGCHNKLSKSTQLKHIQYIVPSLENRPFLFHSESCVALRQYKETIRRYVLDQEVPEEQPTTTLAQYVIRLMENSGHLLELDQKVKRPSFKKAKRSLNPLTTIASGIKSATQGTIETSIELAEVPTEENEFRRRRQLAQVFVRRERQIPATNKHSSRLFREWGILTRVIRYMDVHVYGESLWGVLAANLLVKNDRAAVWRVYRYIAVELPAPVVLRLLNATRDDLSKYKVNFLESLSLGVIEGSAFPMAVALKLSAFMRQRAEFDQARADEFNGLSALCERVAIKFVGDIESDHLLALLLMLPTDVDNGLSTMQIALKYQNYMFLDNSRLASVSSQMYSEYETLNPAKQFRQSELSYAGLFRLILGSPTQFFLTPQGLYVLNLCMYIVYVAILTLVVWPVPRYPYDPIRGVEGWFWITNAGFIGATVVELLSSGEPFVWMVENPVLTLLTSGWLFLAWIRFVGDLVFGVKFPATGPVDPARSRNLPISVVYITTFAILLIASWVRGLRFFTISPALGPMVKMISRMVYDILNFAFMMGIFMVGLMFGLYYIFGQDLCGFQTLWELFLFTFQLMLGAQGVGSVGPQSAGSQTCTTAQFGSGRNQMTIGLIIFMSLFGTVLLMNLLIAIMASTYDYVQNNARQEVVFSRVETAFQYLSNPATLPPPFNVVVVPSAVMYLILNAIINLFSRGAWDFNVQSLLPVHYGFQADVETEEDLSCCGFLKARREPGLCTNPFDKNQANNCRYCYQSVGESPEIDDYVKLFERYKFDQTDLDLMRHLTTDINLCSHCFMPYIRTENSTNLLTKFDIAQQTISFYVYIVLAFIPLVVLLAFPSAISFAIENARAAVKNLEGRSNGVDDTSTTETYRENVVAVIEAVVGEQTTEEVIQDLREEMKELDGKVGTTELAQLKHEIKDLKIMLTDVLGDRLSDSMRAKLAV